MGVFCHWICVPVAAIMGGGIRPQTDEYRRFTTAFPGTEGLAALARALLVAGPLLGAVQPLRSGRGRKTTELLRTGGTLWFPPLPPSCSGGVRRWFLPGVR